MPHSKHLLPRTVCKSYAKVRPALPWCAFQPPRYCHSSLPDSHRRWGRPKPRTQVTRFACPTHSGLPCCWSGTRGLWWARLFMDCRCG
jgi:hypothetical protein